MLLLTSVNDRLQVVTSSAANIDVHADWVDTSAGTITPGRTNTNIAAAATTSVAGAPAASTQRNVKTLHVRNRHATLSCDVTIQHTDGTITAQLYKATLSAGAALEYTDQGGFGGGAMPVPVAGAPTRQIFLSGSGTYTTPVGASWIEVELVGGGGGGGSGNGVNAGTAGGNTTFGALTGSGGAGGVAPGSAAGGLGGAATGGDINIRGGDGASSSNTGDGATIAAGNEGGSSYFGGAGRGLYASNGTSAGANSGSGGGGGGRTDTAINGGGQGGGAGGYVRKLFAPPAATYAYAVGAAGVGGAATGAERAGGNGAAGMIMVTEHYR